MYSILLTAHSFFRWIVLISLFIAIFRASQGYRLKRHFSALDNRIRHWTATIVHIQLLIGMGLYIQSPWVKSGLPGTEPFFFRYIHLLMMITAIVCITIGSAKAKRMDTDKQKFTTMLSWFAIALVIIVIAIPWPFSPLAQRPFLRIH